MKLFTIIITLVLFDYHGNAQVAEINNGYLNFSPYSMENISNIVWLKFNKTIDELVGENIFYEEMKKVKGIDDLTILGGFHSDTLRVLSIDEKFTFFSILIDPRNYLSHYSVGNQIYSFGEKDCFYANHGSIIFNNENKAIFYLLFSSSCNNAILVDLKRGLRQKFIYLNSFGMARINSLFFHTNYEVPPIIEEF